MKKLVIFLTFGFILQTTYAQWDVVYTVSGDELLGEIKNMRQSILTFDTKYADTEFKIEWSEVLGLETSGLSLIFTDDGDRFVGSIKPLLGTGRLTRVITEEEEITMTLEKIVEIISLEKNFVERIRIALDAGYSFTKANSAQTISINGNVNYQARKWAFDGSFNKVGTYQDGADETSRTEGTGNLNYTIIGKSFAFVGLQFLRNSEQLLDLRSTAKGGLGYYFFRTNHWYLGGGAGIAGSRENYGGDEPSSENGIEGLGIINLNAYDIGDLSVNLSASYYPSFTNKGRHRLDADFSLKYDLPFEFYIKVSYNHNFDSKPPIDVSNNDFVFQTSIGWEWN